MRYFILIIVSLFIQQSFGQSKSSDTTFIFREIYDCSYHAVFIENNKKSDYYSLLTDFDFNEYDSASYNESLITLDNNQIIRHAKIPTSLPKRWCTLYSYKNNYYLYAPSDWGNDYRIIITDSTLIIFTMEGPYAAIITNYITIDKNTFEFSFETPYTTIKKITIRIINRKRQIAIFDNNIEGDPQRYTTMVGVSKAKEFPIIVNYCRDRKAMEFDFTTGQPYQRRKPIRVIKGPRQPVL